MKWKRKMCKVICLVYEARTSSSFVKESPVAHLEIWVLGKSTLVDSIATHTVFLLWSTSTNWQPGYKIVATKRELLVNFKWISSISPSTDPIVFLPVVQGENKWVESDLRRPGISAWSGTALRGAELVHRPQLPETHPVLVLVSPSLYPLRSL